MTPGTLVLLHAPLATAAVWGSIPETLRSHGVDVVVPDLHEHGGDQNAAREPSGMGRYVARAALEITAYRPAQPLVLVAQGAAGPLLPPIGAAQRAAHRMVGGYVFADADFPDARTLVGDWPDAPCGYLRTSERCEAQARQARLRGWPVRELPTGHGGHATGTASGAIADAGSAGAGSAGAGSAGAAEALWELVTAL